MADDGRRHGDFTTTDDVKIHYLTIGDAGSWVVLIHGYTGSAEGNWFANGIAQALGERHRVVAIDCRNHGRSDKPVKGGPGRAEDVVELMDHLGIERAHVHGYSMGGLLTARLLGLIPERMISATFGGSGVQEVDPELRAQVPKDPDGVDPAEAATARDLRISFAMNNGKTREEAEAIADRPQPPRREITPEQAERLRAIMGTVDLTKVEIPVLAINGEYDSPYAKTHRLWRELRDFTNVVLPGKSHLTAIVAGSMPPEYLEATVRFIDAHDE
jgi:pimeloyl-ACP methyl ester carboxylesterase